ncbi:MAG: hypothetical protein P0Y55_11970 [Candidatus Cohnella colombiensis]|uniref:Uncharacterized protein n=1 Tax=Candidatus Cohnella colombiensis TaxID=3121368 RepID=A0AA95JEJ0_9BACL|nr:MAG: hypothetical protein P0Y55_11970 [Cohnella sp.]
MGNKDANKDIKIIQVCFNIIDPFQCQLFERVASFPNRSGYVKRLIQWDVEREQAGAPQASYRVNAEAVTEDFNADGFI